VPKLVTTRGPTRGREYELEEICILGRSPSCQIYIGDLTVSRQHARIVRTDRGFVIEDLGSGNGTWVNEARVSQHLLQNNDEVRISEAVFRFVEEAKPEGRWVNMVTVIAGSEPGLISTQTEPRVKFFDTQVDLSEEDLRADLARTHRMLETLYAAANATSSILEPKRLFNKILEYLLNVFPDAELGYIMQLDDKNQLVPGAIRRQRGSEPHGSGGLVVSQSVISQVMHEGKSVLSAGRMSERHTLSPYGSSASKMCAPLSAQGKTHGILHIEGKLGGKPFTQEDLDLLTGIARLAAVAILSASLHQRLMRQQRLEQDLRFAKRVQQSFLPLEPPEVPGFAFARRYNPLYEVGGDFYDFIPLPNGRIGIAIGDVSGKGVAAALLMARLTSDIRYFGIAEQDPARVLDRVNASLISSVQDNMFATVLYLLLDPRGKLFICNAGHIPPMVRRRDGTVLQVEEASNLALGVLPDPVFDQTVIQLEVGDSVLLCTDGLVEAKNGLGDEYGFSRLEQTMGKTATDSMIDAILKDLMHFTGPTPQYDDLTLVSFSRID
jgi:sigma-B regulation protein RsbU (phosphoserine phosphatase)